MRKQPGTGIFMRVN